MPISWMPDLSMMVITESLALSFHLGIELPKPSWNAPWSVVAGYSSARISLLLLSHSSSSSKSTCNWVLKWYLRHKEFHDAQFESGMDSQSVQIVSTPNLPQPQWNKVFSYPFLNSVKRKQLVWLSAALLAKYRCRKAVGAPPLKQSRLATLACSRCRNALGIKEAVQ